MGKEILVLSLDFIFGPLSKDYQTTDGTEITGIKVVDEDNEIQKLDQEINDIWCSLWTKNNFSTSGYDFDEKREKEVAPILIDLVRELIKRLDKINDGSYEIEDMITNHLESLINN